MLNHTKRQGNIKMTTMFITAVCIVFLIKPRWPSNKSLYDAVNLFTDKLIFMKYISHSFIMYVFFLCTRGAFARKKS